MCFQDNSGFEKWQASRFATDGYCGRELGVAGGAWVSLAGPDLANARAFAIRVQIRDAKPLAFSQRTRVCEAGVAVRNRAVTSEDHAREVDRPRSIP